MIYYIAYFFINSTFVIINPYLQVVFRNMGYSFEYIGIFQATFEAAGILGPLALGYLADRKGWFKPLCMISLVVTSFAFYSLSLNLGFIAILFALMLTGFSFRSVAPLFDSIGTLAADGDNSKYSKFRSFGTLGYVVVSSVLSFFKRPIVNNNTNISLYFFIICGIAMVTLIFIPVKIKEIPTQEERKQIKSENGKWYTPGLVVGLLLISFSRFSMSAVYGFLSLYSIEVVKYDNLTLLNAVGALSEFFIILLSGYLLKKNKVSSWFLIILGTLGVVIRYAIYILFPTVPGILIAQIFHCFCYGSLHVGAIAFITENVRKDHRGIGISLYFALATGLPAVLGSSIGGVIVSNLGYNSLFFIYGVISFIAVLYGLYYRKLLTTKSPYIN